MPSLDWTGIPPAVGAVVSAVVALLQLYRGRRSRVDAAPSAPEDTDAVLPLEAGSSGLVMTAVRVEVAGPAAVRLEVASSVAAVTVCVVAVPAQPLRSSAKERAPW
ncbi:hypothetical protein [Streptomyces sp. NPDC048357]|uniref:hypothetical protein n=1 Tax=Streptomyces sp. NPDC048357 TaxID=3154719 RepID=UPI0034152906